MTCIVFLVPENQNQIFEEFKCNETTDFVMFKYKFVFTSILTSKNINKKNPNSCFCTSCNNVSQVFSLNSPSLHVYFI